MDWKINSAKLKAKILDYFAINEENNTDRDIITFLCLASNTLSTTEHAFVMQKAIKGSLMDFYAFVTTNFIAQGMFPMGVQLILKTYPNVFDRVLENQFSKKRVFTSIWNNNTQPCIDAGIVKIPLPGEWGPKLNLGFILKNERRGALATLLDELPYCVQYKFTDTVKLVTGNETRSLKAGCYTFCAGKNWLVFETEW